MSSWSATDAQRSRRHDEIPALLLGTVEGMIRKPYQVLGLRLGNGCAADADGHLIGSPEGGLPCRGKGMADLFGEHSGVAGLDGEDGREFLSAQPAEGPPRQVLRQRASKDAEDTVTSSMA